METRYITSAAKAHQLPDFQEEEIAFIGRSNAGKSSLLNAIMARKSLARTGRTPGQTKMISFFQYGDKHILVDLPGYGYHEAAYHSITKHWDHLMQRYLERPNLRAVVFLMDIRRKMDRDDRFFLDELCRNHTVLVALTKADKVNRQKTQAAVKKMREDLKADRIDAAAVMPVSALKKQGVDLLKQAVFASSRRVSQS